MNEFEVVEPITDDLRDLEEWKRCTVAVEDDRGASGHVEYVTVEFHDAFVAEIRARWERDIARLNSIVEILQS